jgi:hypothetical protein
VSPLTPPRLLAPSRPRLVALLLLLLFLAVPLASHDLFVKLERYRVPADTPMRAPVLNGTFSTSENAITPDRIADLSLVGPGGRSRLELAAVSARNDTTFVAFRTGGPGTYALGFSTRPRELRLSGAAFAGYLEEEGLEDVLAERRRAGTVNDSVTERYSKHVKAVFQVGEARSDDFGTVLRYPAELVALDNPYQLRVGGTLRVRCLTAGEPAANVVVIAGGRTPPGNRIPVSRTRSGAEGEAVIRLTHPGKWYVKFIKMSPRTGGVDYESVWATLTFEVGR